MTAVDLSSGELTHLVKLATRGVGYSWGVSAEMSHFCQWAIQYCPAMVNHLGNFLCWKVQESNHVIVSGSSLESGVLKKTVNDLPYCPIALGISLCDFAYELNKPVTLNMERVVSPILILPYCDEVRKVVEYDVVLSWSDVTLLIKDNAIEANAAFYQSLDQPGRQTEIHNLSITLNNAAGYLSTDETYLNLKVYTSSDRQAAIPDHRIVLQKETIDRLKQLAHRTYAPASEESRRLGAGAGTLDND